MTEPDPDGDDVETATTRSPQFDEAVPHSSTPAGEIYFAGAVARRLGPTVIRAAIVGALVALTVVLVIEVS
jgi:hypothetical protein